MIEEMRKGKEKREWHKGREREGERGKSGKEGAKEESSEGELTVQRHLEAKMEEREDRRRMRG